MGEKPAFDPSKYLDSPSYGEMTGKLTGKQVLEIANARMRRKAQLDAQEAKSKMTDAASANAGLEGL